MNTLYGQLDESGAAAKLLYIIAASGRFVYSIFI